MKLVKYENVSNDPFAYLERWLDDAFYGFDRSSVFGGDASWSNKSVPTNVYEDNENFYVVAEIPGFDKKHVKVELENSVLTISADRNTKSKDAKASETIHRSITVGENVDSAKVKAKMENGILRVTLPKREEVKPKAITVS